jgi:hypothetical protein
MLRSSLAAADAWRLEQGKFTVPEAAFGDTASAKDVRAALQETVDSADVTVGRLAAVLEGDMDRLYRTAFAYQRLDEEEAREFQRLHPNIPI